MTRWLKALIVLAVIMPAWAPAAPGQEAPPGPLVFNPRTVETVAGMVVEAPQLKPGGIPEMEHLVLQAKQEKLAVVLGPNWFLARQDWKISNLDRLEVTGSRVILDGKPTLLAQEVKRGGQVMKFRDQAGRPLWARPHPQAQ